MSYYCNRGAVTPGPINGSALDGLHTRVTIACKRVLDSCKKCISLENTRLALRRAPQGVAPFTFVNGLSTQVDATISDLSVTRLEERPCFARIKCTVSVPVQVTVDDASGVRSTVPSEIVVPEDIVMYVPEASMFPFEIVACASCNCAAGAFDADGNCNVTACMTVITKVIAETDLLVPAYGYCPTPTAVDYEEQICNRFFDLPMYPSGK